MGIIPNFFTRKDKISDSKKVESLFAEINGIILKLAKEFEERIKTEKIGLIEIVREMINQLSRPVDMDVGDLGVKKQLRETLEWLNELETNPSEEIIIRLAAEFERQSDIEAHLKKQGVPYDMSHIHTKTYKSAFNLLKRISQQAIEVENIGYVVTDLQKFKKMVTRINSKTVFFQVLGDSNLKKRFDLAQKPYNSLESKDKRLIVTALNTIRAIRKQILTVDYNKWPHMYRAGEF
jgi:acyl-CoA-binding protein